MTNKGASTEYSVGGLVGALAYSDLTNSYWAENIKYDPYDVIHDPLPVSGCFTLSEDMSVGSYKDNSFIDALNAGPDPHAACNCQHWLLNSDYNRVSFRVNNRSIFKINSQRIMTFDFTEEDANWFGGWYTDEECTEEVKDSEIKANTTIYSKLGIHSEICVNTKKVYLLSVLDKKKITYETWLECACVYQGKN